MTEKKEPRILREYEGARLTKDFEMRERDGSVTIIPAGTHCVVLEIYHNPLEYEMEFTYTPEGFNIAIPADIVEPDPIPFPSSSLEQ